MSSSTLYTLMERTLHAPQAPEIRERLQRKLREYEARAARLSEKYRARPYGIVVDRDDQVLDAVYKAELLRTLLDEGSVRVEQAHERLRDEFGGHVSDNAFVNAVCVIDDYLRTGGAHTHGGTGFFTRELFDELLERLDVLRCPDDAATRTALLRKLHEYMGRALDYEQRAESTLDRGAMLRDGYKVRILEAMRDGGSAELRALAAALRAEQGGLFDEIEFYRAATRIRELLGAARAGDPGRSSAA